MQGNAYGLGFGPINVDLYRISGLLEIGDHERVVSIAEGMNPQAHANRSRQVAYWADYGQALARLRGRHEDAVRAPRRAEPSRADLSPPHPAKSDRPRGARRVAGALAAGCSGPGVAGDGLPRWFAGVARPEGVPHEGETRCC